MNPPLSVAMIVRDERERLPACLQSLASLGGLLLEVCIYDTGSTDGTPELAEQSGAVVRRGYWDDDFGRARNEALAMCRAPWVLIVDADESVWADPLGLQALLEAADTDLVDVEVTSQSADGDRTWRSVRIGRTGYARYVGRVHESLISPRGRETVTSLASDVLRIETDGYVDEALTRAKLSRNARIAAAAASGATTVGERSVALMHAARAEEALGDEAAWDHYAEVIGLDPHGEAGRWAAQRVSRYHLDRGDLVAAAEAVDRLVAAHGGQHPYEQYMLGRLFLLAGDAGAASTLLQPLDQVDDAGGMTVPLTELRHSQLRAAAAAGDLAMGRTRAGQLIDLGLQEEFGPLAARLDALIGRG